MEERVLQNVVKVIRPMKRKAPIAERSIHPAEKVLPFCEGNWWKETRSPAALVAQPPAGRCGGNPRGISLSSVGRYVREESPRELEEAVATFLAQTAQA